MSNNTIIHRYNEDVDQNWITSSQPNQKPIYHHDQLTDESTLAQRIHESHTYSPNPAQLSNQPSVEGDVSVCVNKHDKVNERGKENADENEKVNDNANETNDGNFGGVDVNLLDDSRDTDAGISIGCNYSSFVGELHQSYNLRRRIALHMQGMLAKFQRTDMELQTIEEEYQYYKQQRREVDIERQQQRQKEGGTGRRRRRHHHHNTHHNDTPSRSHQSTKRRKLEYASDDEEASTDLNHDVDSIDSNPAHNHEDDHDDIYCDNGNDKHNSNSNERDMEDLLSADGNFNNGTNNVLNYNTSPHSHSNASGNALICTGNQSTEMYAQQLHQLQQQQQPPIVTANIASDDKSGSGMDYPYHTLNNLPLNPAQQMLSPYFTGQQQSISSPQSHYYSQHYNNNNNNNQHPHPHPLPALSHLPYNSSPPTQYSHSLYSNANQQLIAQLLASQVPAQAPAHNVSPPTTPAIIPSSQPQYDMNMSMNMNGLSYASPVQSHNATPYQASPITSPNHSSINQQLANAMIYSDDNANLTPVSSEHDPSDDSDYGTSKRRKSSDSSPKQSGTGSGSGSASGSRKKQQRQKHSSSHSSTATPTGSTTMNLASTKSASPSGRVPHANAANVHGSTVVRKRGKTLPEGAISMMKEWLFEHFDHPYPSESVKKELADRLGLKPVQVGYWFINARARKVRKNELDQEYLEWKKKRQENPHQHQQITQATNASTPAKASTGTRNHKKHGSGNSMGGSPVQHRVATVSLPTQATAIHPTDSLMQFAGTVPAQQLTPHADMPPSRQEQQQERERDQDEASNSEEIVKALVTAAQQVPHSQRDEEHEQLTDADINAEQQLRGQQLLQQVHQQIFENQQLQRQLHQQQQRQRDGVSYASNIRPSAYVMPLKIEHTTGDGGGAPVLAQRTLTPTSAPIPATIPTHQTSHSSASAPIQANYATLPPFNDINGAQAATPTLAAIQPQQPSAMSRDTTNDSTTSSVTTSIAQPIQQQYPHPQPQLPHTHNHTHTQPLTSATVATSGSGAPISMPLLTPPPTSAASISASSIPSLSSSQSNSIPSAADRILGRTSMPMPMPMPFTPPSHPASLSASSAGPPINSTSSTLNYNSNHQNFPNTSPLFPVYDPSVSTTPPSSILSSPPFDGLGTLPISSPSQQYHTFTSPILPHSHIPSAPFAS